MDSNNDHLKLVGLVTRARLGDRESLSQLAELVEGRLLAYIYRLTLDLDLARELLQETLLEMVKSVSEIKHPERFWFWLFRTALGKVQHHFRGQQRRRKIQLSAFEKERLSLQSLQDYDEGLDELIRQELSGAVFEAMDRLRISHRNVLALRCFEQMPYAEIAALMDCSEIKARVLFCRAKMALRKRLSHHGFSKAYLLVALGLFGLLTTPAKAASTAGPVTAASLEVGSAAAVIGAVGTKLGITIVAAITAATVTITINFFLYVFAGIIVFLFVLGFITLVRLYE